MGQFSWLDCVDQSQIVDNKRENVYVLIPKEFGGGHIVEPCYNGYGDFGGNDIYDLVALWNRDAIDLELVMSSFRSFKEPSIDDYYGFSERHINALKEEGFTEHEIKEMEYKQKKQYCDDAISYAQYRRKMLRDFVEHVEDEIMEEQYGKDWLREIGISIACYDDENEKLEFPIKITHDANTKYEWERPSLSDPDQGWERDEEEEEWY